MGSCFLVGSMNLRMSLFHSLTGSVPGFEMIEDITSILGVNFLM